MDVTNHKIILKEFSLLCNNCNTLEDNILEIGTVCFPENNYNKDIIEISQKNTIDTYVKNIKLVNSKVAKILTYSNTLLAKFKKYKIGNRDIDFKTLTKNANANAKVRMRRKTDSVVVLKKFDVESRKTPVLQVSSSTIPNKLESSNDKSKIKDENISRDKGDDSNEINKDNGGLKSKDNKLKSPPVHPIVKSILSTCKPKIPESGTKVSHSRKSSVVDKNVKNNKDAKSLNDRLSRIKEKSDSTNSIIDDTQKFIENLKKKLKETTLSSESDISNYNEEKSKEEKEKVEKEKGSKKSLSTNNKKIKNESDCLNSSSTKSPTRPISIKKPSSIQTNVKATSQTTKKSPNTPTRTKVVSQTMKSPSNTPTPLKMTSKSTKKLSSSPTKVSSQTKKPSTPLNINMPSSSIRKTPNTPTNTKVSSKSTERLSNSPTKKNKRTSTSNRIRSSITSISEEKKKTKKEDETIPIIDVDNNEQSSDINEEVKENSSLGIDKETNNDNNNMDEESTTVKEKFIIEESTSDMNKEIINKDQSSNEMEDNVNISTDDILVNNSIDKMDKTIDSSLDNIYKSDKGKINNLTLETKIKKEHDVDHSGYSENKKESNKDTVNNEIMNPTISNSVVEESETLTLKSPSKLDSSTIPTSELSNEYKKQNEELKKALYDLFDQYDNLNQTINDLKNDNTLLLENQFAQNEIIKEYEYEIQILMLRSQQQDLYPYQAPNEPEYYEESLINPEIQPPHVDHVDNLANPLEGQISSYPQTPLMDEQIIIANAESIPEGIDYSQPTMGDGGYTTSDYNEPYNNTNEIISNINGSNNIDMNGRPIIEPIPKLVFNTPSIKMDMEPGFEMNIGGITSQLTTPTKTNINDHPLEMTTENSMIVPSTLSSFHDQSNTLDSEQLILIETNHGKDKSTGMENEEDENNISKRLDLLEARIASNGTLDRDSSMDSLAQNHSWPDDEINCPMKQNLSHYANNEEYYCSCNDEVLMSPYLSLQDINASHYNNIQNQSNMDRYTTSGSEFEPVISCNGDNRSLLFQDDNSSYARSIHSLHSNSNEMMDPVIIYSQDQDAESIYGRSFYSINTNEMEPHTLYPENEDDIINNQLFQSIIDKQNQITDIGINIVPPSTPLDPNHITYPSLPTDNGNDHLFSSLQKASSQSPPLDLPQSSQRFQSTSAIPTSPINASPSLGTTYNSQTQNFTQALPQQSLSPSNHGLHHPHPKPRPIITSSVLNSNSNKSPTNNTSLSSFHYNYPMNAMAVLESSPPKPLTTINHSSPINDIHDNKREPMSANPYDSDYHQSSSPSFSSSKHYNHPYGNNFTTKNDYGPFSDPIHTQSVTSSIFQQVTDDRRGYQQHNNEGGNDVCIHTTRGSGYSEGVENTTGTGSGLRTEQTPKSAPLPLMSSNASLSYSPTSQIYNNKPLLSYSSFLQDSRLFTNNNSTTDISSSNFSYDYIYEQEHISDFHPPPTILEEESRPFHQSIPNLEMSTCMDGTYTNDSFDSMNQMRNNSQSPHNIYNNTINTPKNLSINTTNINDNNASFSSNYSDNLTTPTNAVPFPSKFSISRMKMPLSATEPSSTPAFALTNGIRRSSLNVISRENENMNERTGLIRERFNEETNVTINTNTNTNTDTNTNMNTNANEEYHSFLLSKPLYQNQNMHSTSLFTNSTGAYPNSSYSSSPTSSSYYYQHSSPSLSSSIPPLNYPRHHYRPTSPSASFPKTLERLDEVDSTLGNVSLRQSSSFIRTDSSSFVEEEVPK